MSADGDKLYYQIKVPNGHPVYEEQRFRPLDLL